MASIGKQDSGKAELENRTVDTMVGDGSATTLVLSSVPISINNVLIFISGIMQRPTTDYTLSGSTITFSEAPITGLKVVAITGGGEHIGIPLTKLGTDKFMDIAVTDAKIASGISASKLTGALPALDGSALTGASGANVSGVDTVTTSDPAVNTDPASAGHIWLNRTSAEMFVCTDNTAGANVWINVGEGTGAVPVTYMSATGGTITTDGNFKVHTFNSSGTFTPTIGSAVTVGDTVEYLVIAGAGGGGGSLGNSSVGSGGGGGAGGYLTATGYSVTSTGYTVTVGGGGAGGGPAGGSNATQGENSIFGVGITSIGGGRGGSYDGGSVGGNGGSGGGGGYTGVAGGTGTAGQGNDGGSTPYNPSPAYGSGGGGGSGAVGAVGSGSAGGAGGAGTANSITGSSVIRAGGGGGGADSVGSGGAAGCVGAGAGSNSAVTAGAGSVNTGSAGGGGGNNSSSVGGAGGAGGSGVVIVRYQFQ